MGRASPPGTLVPDRLPIACLGTVCPAGDLPLRALRLMAAPADTGDPEPHNVTTAPPTSPFSASLISGDRALASDAFAGRIAGAAGGFAALGLGQGDCAALLMRNDFAFLEASLAAVRLGAYAVPVNWHFKAEEVAYILADCGAKVLVGHADLLAAVAAAIPGGVTVLPCRPAGSSRRAYRPVARCRASVPAGATVWDELARRADALAAARRCRPTSSMIYTSGTTGRPKGVRRTRPTPSRWRAMGACARASSASCPACARVVPGPALSLRAQRLRAARRARAAQPDRADAALRSGGVAGADRARIASTPCSWCRPCSCGC